ncbi:ATP phosphoribosyltransferase regulatory subunit [Leptospira ognonensis]|nr:ATP phosphoribosyltransferase regulatory subunit [Leptospira ognonensis]
MISLNCLLGHAFQVMNAVKKSKLSERRWIPDGFHFLGPEESRNRRHLLQSLIECLEVARYSEINLPAFDYTSSYQTHIGGLDSSAFLIAKDYDGFSLSPGVDLTLQVVKGMAGRSHWEENQNVFYIGRKIRDHKKRNASRREILQIGGESIGDSSPENVISQILILEKMWKVALPETKASLVLGHAGFLSFVFDTLKLDPSDEAIIAQFLYTKNEPELAHFVKNKDLSPSSIQLLKLTLKPLSFDGFQDFKKSLLGISSEIQSNKTLADHLLEMEAFILNWKNKKVGFTGVWDPSLIRDLDYYSGLVFQGYMEGFSEPVFAGGVYNNLYETYAEIKKDACGFALHIDPIEEKIYSKK